MNDDLTAIQWARKAEFDRPILMGAIEREVQSRPLDELPSGRGVPPWIVVTVLALPAFAPAIGAILLFANPATWGGEPAWSVEFSSNAYIVGFLLGCLMAIGSVVTWLVDGRERSGPTITVLAVNAVTSTITEILRRLPGFAGPEPGLVTPQLTLAVGSVIALTLVLTLSRPPAEPSVIERDIDSLDHEGKRLLYNRTEVLRILVERGVIPREKMSTAILAPLGGWSELD